MEMKRGSRTICSLLLGLVAVACAGCAVRTQPGSPAVAVQAAPDAPDYALAENWVWCGIGESKAADLFLICPTVDMRDETNLSLDDAETKAAFAGALAMERGIFAETQLGQRTFACGSPAVACIVRKVRLRIPVARLEERLLRELPAHSASPCNAIAPT